MGIPSPGVSRIASGKVNGVRLIVRAAANALMPQMTNDE
jgi:hypothetical protein